MNDGRKQTLHSWISLLYIASRFKMDRIRERAIKEIVQFKPRINPVDQVVLAVKFSIPSWLPIAYAALCRRWNPIEVEEARKLGVDTTALLAKARERIRHEERPGDKEKIQDNKELDWDMQIPADNIRCIKEEWGAQPFDFAPPSRPPSPAFSRCSGSVTAHVNESLVDRVIREVFWPEPPPPSEKLNVDVSFLSLSD